MMLTHSTAMLLTAVAALTASGGDQTDKDLFQGPWRVVSAEISGKKVAGDELKEMQKDPMVFRGDKLIGRYEATFTLDPAKKPKEIDVVTAAGKEKMTFRGIYRLEGDELTLCLGTEANGARPASFTTKPGDKAGVIVLQRMK
jgi:uncharacterized protein (TIGR03067 family)